MPKSIWELDFKEMVTGGLSRVDKAISGTFGKMEQFDSKLRAMQTSHGEGMFGGVAGEIMKAGAGLFAIDKIAEYGAEMVAVGAKTETFKAQLGSLTGSAERGAKVFEELKSITASGILPDDALIGAGKALLAIGYPLDRIKGKVQQLAELSGGDAQQLNMLSDAYARMLGTGRVNPRMLMEFPVLAKEMQRITHLSGPVLQQAMEEGAIGIKSVDKAIANLTGTGGMFSHTLEDIANTTAGKYTLLRGKIEDEFVKIYQAAQPAINALLDLGAKVLPPLINGFVGMVKAAIGVAAWLDKNKWAVWGITAAIGSWVVIEGGLRLALMVREGLMLSNNVLLITARAFTMALADGMGVLEAAQWALNFAMDANPIGAIITAIGLLVAGLVYAYNKFGWFRDGVNAIGEAIMEVFRPLRDIFNDIKNGDWGSAGKHIAEYVIKLSILPIYAGMKGAFAAYKSITGPSVAAATSGPSFMQGVLEDARGLWQTYGGGKPGKPQEKGDGSLDSMYGLGTDTKIRNVIVNIHQLVGEVKIAANTVKEGTAQMSSLVAEHLVAACNNAELALGTQ